MRSNKDKEQRELNEAPITLVTFLELYNRNIPVGFSRASTVKLKRFQEAHPMLFKDNDMWSIARHRKRLIDWLSSNSGS